MFNKVKRIGSLLLALVMVFSLAACKSTENSSSDETQIIYEYEYEYEEGAEGTTGTTGTTQSGNNTTTSTGSKNNTSGEMSGTTVDLSKLKGTTVRYATWLEPENNEDGPVVEKFQKEYGITVKIDIIAQDDYVNTVANRIAAGDSPDIYFSNNDFPAAMQCLQSLDATKLDFSDEIWNQKTLELTTYGGQPYLLDTVGNIWAETDCIYYNKKILEQAGFSADYPAELYKAGKWTWDAMEQIMRACSQLGGGISGGEFMSLDSLISSAGNNLLTNEKGTFSSGINSNFISAFKRIAKWYSDGICGKQSWRSGFIEGKVAIVQTHSFGLKQTGHWKDMNWNNIGYTYLPAYDSNSTAYQTGCFRGWGLIRGAANPEGAGVFLRYYLDSGNYDGGDAFITSEAETFFYQLTNTGMDDYNPYYTFGGYTKDLTGFDSVAVLDIPKNFTADQVEAEVKSYEREAKNAADYINNFLTQNTGIK